MTITGPTVDDLAQLCAALARDEACEIMKEIRVEDLTACEIVALLTILRPARERRRQPAPVLKLVRSDTRAEAIDRLDPFGVNSSAGHCGYGSTGPSRSIGMFGRPDQKLRRGLVQPLEDHSFVVAGDPAGRRR